MDPSSYERVTAEIARSVFVRAEGLQATKVLFGRSNKWEGGSGFSHQIDVAIHNSTDVVLVECKHWASRAVRVEHLLTFIARVHDIRMIEKRTIHPVMVASTSFQSGCHVLAAHYGIDLEVIASPGSFAFQYKGLRSVGIEPQPGAMSIQGYAPTVHQTFSEPHSKGTAHEG